MPDHSQSLNYTPIPEELFRHIQSQTSSVFISVSISVLFITLVLIGVIVYRALPSQEKTTTYQKIRAVDTCDIPGINMKDTKACPDGSIVKREGKFCDFAPCPSSTQGLTDEKHNLQFKTYKSDVFHFSVDYPSSWIRQENSHKHILLPLEQFGNILFTNEDVGELNGLLFTEGKGMQVTYAPSNKEWSLERWADEVIPMDNRLISEKTTISGLPAIKIIYKTSFPRRNVTISFNTTTNDGIDGRMVAVLLKRSDDVGWIIQAATTSDLFPVEFDRMLSSFKVDDFPMVYMSVPNQ